MAGTVGRSARDLIEEISRDGSGFEFFQAIRLLALAETQVKPGTWEDHIAEWPEWEPPEKT